MRKLISLFAGAALILALDYARARAQEFPPLPDAGWQGAWSGPLLVCWQAQRLIDALQPGVQGLPEHCTTLAPPVSFQVQSPALWRGVFTHDGAPYLVGVYAIYVTGRAGELFTVLGVRARE